jgi:DNA-binding NtrC family response regulator
MICAKRHSDPLLGDIDHGAALIGTSFAAQALRAALDPLSRSPVNLVLCGEPGVGKRDWVEALACYGGGPAGPVPVLHLNGHADEQIEDLFFRADEGSGLAALPAGSLIHLDAIDAASPRLQAHLADWLSTRQRWPVRLVGATTIPLDELVRRGRFSAALHALLGIVQLRIPPLRDRHQDIRPIAEHWLARRWGATPRAASLLDEGAAAQLRQHTWPGNVRELLTVLRAASADGVLRPLTADRVRAALGPRRGRRRDPSEIVPLGRVETDYIVLAVERCGGNHALAARRLGIGRSTLIRKLKLARNGASAET